MRSYDQKLVETTFKRKNLKKLLHDTCTKVDFIANGKIYEQLDSVIMGSFLDQS